MTGKYFRDNYDKKGASRGIVSAEINSYIESLCDCGHRRGNHSAQTYVGSWWSEKVNLNKEIGTGSCISRGQCGCTEFGMFDKFIENIRKLNK